MEAAQQRAVADQRRLHGAKQTATLELGRTQAELHSTTTALAKVEVSASLLLLLQSCLSHGRGARVAVAFVLRCSHRLSCRGAASSKAAEASRSSLLHQQEQAH